MVKQIGFLFFGIQATWPMWAAALPLGSPTFWQLHQRETEILPVHELVGEDKEVETQVEAISAPEFKFDSTRKIYTFEAENGSDGKFACAFHRERIDPSHSVYGLMRGFVPKTFTTELLNLNVQVERAQPILHLYVKVQNPKKEIEYNVVKIAVISRRETTIICHHNAIGYAKSFERWVRAIALQTRMKSLNPSRRSPLYQEIQILRLGQMKVGFTHSFLMDGEKGEKNFASFSSLMVPKGKSDLKPSDSSALERTDLKGILLGGSYVSITDKKLDYRLTLTRENGNNYRLKGKDKKLKVDQLLQSRAPLYGTYGHFRRLKDLVSKGLPTDSINGYFPEIKAQDVSALRITRTQNKKGKQSWFTYRIRGFKSRVIIDRFGTIERMVQPYQAVEMISEREFRSGLL